MTESAYSNTEDMPLRERILSESSNEEDINKFELPYKTLFKQTSLRTHAMIKTKHMFKAANTNS